MRIKFLALLIAALGFGFAPSIVVADDVKPAEKKAEKKGGCCGDDEKCDEEKPAAKKDGCGDCEKGDDKNAKKEEGCDGCGKDTKAFAKAISCKECANSEKGPCEKCAVALKEGKVTFIPVKGMMCGNCEGAVSAKLEKIEGVQKYAVMHRFNGVAVFVEPGKTVKLSDLTKALGKGKFEIDETAKLAGAYTIKLNCKDEKSCKSACEILCALLGIKECKSCCTGVDFNATGKNITIKQIKDKLAEGKVELADIEIHGPKLEKSKS